MIAESYERIHRSNLVGMGILPFQYLPGQSTDSLGLTGEEVFSIGDHPGALQKMLDSKFADGRTLPILAETAMARPPSSPPPSASIRRRKSSTTSTAASSNTSSAN